MNLKLHHINLSTNNVGAMDDFYKDVLGLKRHETDMPSLEKNKGYSGDVAIVSDGETQMHLSERDVMAGFRTGQLVNPVERGHIAFRTDDIKAFMAQLDEKGIPYSDWKHLAVSDWHQIFFFDPDGNVIEVHEVLE
ncbi:MAG: VOC family protein [Rhizobiaceae bacterium]|nr:VOC family protein [Rhizobiaceae bacterium]